MGTQRLQHVAIGFGLLRPSAHRCGRTRRLAAIDAAVIVEAETSTLVPAGFRAGANAAGHLLIERMAR